MMTLNTEVDFRLDPGQGLAPVEDEPSTGSIKNVSPLVMGHAKGCLLGALIGDAAGATLEFLGRKPKNEEVAHAMRMTGGGVWQTAPGQVTDDGEMTISLCYALAGTKIYCPNRAAKVYREWALSEPFDIGFATSSALKDGAVHDPALSAVMYRNARTHNRDSEANGCLMRATPLGIWSAGVDIDSAIIYSHLDTRLTHPSPTCQWLTAAYVVAIRHLLLNPGDNLGAVEAAESVLARRSELLIHIKNARHGRLPAFVPHSGHIVIGFTHAFFHLYEGNNFVEAISQILSGGGDTDTNACIVGGLIGAFVGVDGLPGEMVSAVINSDHRQGQPRPDWLHPKHLDRLVRGLLQCHTVAA